ncbi:MAG: flippase-like domain-containing protein [Polyangiaceae bacterium]|nr:flippase-like domain-containing protein [Polyangiaceae bacterium]
MGRGVLIAQLGVLALGAGVDIDVLGSFIVGGLQMLALAAGCLVPGQIGVTEGSLVVCADAFGATAAQALSIGLLLHVVQVALVPIGASLPIFWRAPEAH